MDQEHTFSVILDPQEEGGYTVYVTGLPEVVTEGDTEEEALRNAEEAIRLALDYRRENGLPVANLARPGVHLIKIAA